MTDLLPVGASRTVTGGPPGPVRRRCSRWLGIVVVIGGLLMVGCGDSDDTDATDVGATTSNPPTTAGTTTTPATTAEVPSTAAPTTTAPTTTAPTTTAATTTAATTTAAPADALFDPATWIGRTQDAVPGPQVHIDGEPVPLYHVGGLCTDADCQYVLGYVTDTPRGDDGQPYPGERWMLWLEVLVRYEGDLPVMRIADVVVFDEELSWDTDCTADGQNVLGFAPAGDPDEGMFVPTSAWGVDAVAERIVELDPGAVDCEYVLG